MEFGLSARAVIMDGEVTTRLCFCDERLAAMASRTFRWSYDAGGWFLTDVPTRSMSSTARFRAMVDRAEYEHIDHTGERYIYVECPWCLGTLPGCE